MSDKKNDGGPAYPNNGNYSLSPSVGISLRDHFAGIAPAEEVNAIMVKYIRSAWLDALTEARYIWADAMIKARDHSPNTQIP